MTSLHDLTDPLREDSLEKLQRPLKSLQGNILRGHGRDRAVHIFLQFKEDKRTEVKRWSRRLAKRITSAQQQLDETERYRQYSIPGRLFMSFFLSAKGYEYLYTVPKEQLRFNSEAFREGMEGAGSRLDDPPKADWEKEYRQDIHAMVLLADDDQHFLLRATRKLLEGVKTHAEICAVEHGRVMRNEQGQAVEHFGFADSVSQPLFFQSDIERKGQERAGAGPAIVLAPDPYGRDGCDYGSYLVFRKLEQRVRAFKEHEQKLAEALKLPADEVNRAGALVMGRFEDGTPLVLRDTAHPSASMLNDFTYDEDRDGQKCPFQAHIRKVNPRTPDVPRIVRRGITYGEREKEPKDNPSLADLPEKDVGLLFMCYQRNIERQFETLQYYWANDPRFFPSRQESGIDPVIGQPGKMGVGRQTWPATWGAARAEHKSFPFHGFVTLKGGEYFFAPSIHFLKNVGREDE
jgi:Dyp-type peroxidase family